jgi:GTP-binding protein LepA
MRKCLEKQKKPEERMKQFGAINVPQEAFLAVLKVDM